MAARTAGAQQKLARINAEEDGRLQAGERFLTADPEESLRLNRNLLNAQTAHNVGNLNSFQSEDRRGILEVLGLFGHATLPGFTGSPVASDVRRNLIQNSAGGVFNLTADQRGERQSLEATVSQRYEAAATALTEFATSQQSTSEKFFDNLRGAHEKFFETLANNLKREELTTLQNRQGDVGSRLNTLNESRAQA